MSEYNHDFPIKIFKVGIKWLKFITPRNVWVAEKRYVKFCWILEQNFFLGVIHALFFHNDPSCCLYIRSIVSWVRVYWWKTICVFYSFLLEHRQYMDAWHFGFMALWIHGSLDSWQFGFLALWIHGSLDALLFTKTPITPQPAAVQVKTFYIHWKLFTVKAQKLKTPKDFWY